MANYVRFDWMIKHVSGRHRKIDGIERGRSGEVIANTQRNRIFFDRFR